MLVVADLHLEKGSSYAARRVFLPPYDTSATLARLAAVVARLNPRRVVTLGDSFHDRDGAARLLPHDVQALRAMQAGRDWLWIAGNHDPAPPATLEGDHATQLAVGSMCLRHEPSVAPCDGEIAGHLHPVAIVGGKSGAVRRRCFVADRLRCILPAFGAYAGGLNFLDAAFTALLGAGEHHAHVLGRDAVYTVARHQCLVERTSLELWR
jgi:DNA ligase-associated metallophosphoesterase